MYKEEAHYNLNFKGLQDTYKVIWIIDHKNQISN